MSRLMALLVVVIVVFGSQDLLRLARTLERTPGELRRVSEELTRTIHAELETLERDDAAPSPAT